LRQQRLLFGGGVTVGLFAFDRVWSAIPECSPGGVRHGAGSSAAPPSRRPANRHGAQWAPWAEALRRP